MSSAHKSRVRFLILLALHQVGTRCGDDAAHHWARRIRAVGGSNRSRLGVNNRPAQRHRDVQTVHTACDSFGRRASTPRRRPPGPHRPAAAGSRPCDAPPAAPILRYEQAPLRLPWPAPTGSWPARVAGVRLLAMAWVATIGRRCGYRPLLPGCSVTKPADVRRHLSRGGRPVQNTEAMDLDPERAGRSLSGDADSCLGWMTALRYRRRIRRSRSPVPVALLSPRAAHTRRPSAVTPVRTRHPRRDAAR